MQTQIHLLHGHILPHGLGNFNPRINAKFDHGPLTVQGHLDTSKTQGPKDCHGNKKPYLEDVVTMRISKHTKNYPNTCKTMQD